MVPRMVKNSLFFLIRDFFLHISFMLCFHVLIFEPSFIWLAIFWELLNTNIHYPLTWYVLLSFHFNLYECSLKYAVYYVLDVFCVLLGDYKIFNIKGRNYKNEYAEFTSAYSCFSIYVPKQINIKVVEKNDVLLIPELSYKTLET